MYILQKQPRAGNKKNIPQRASVYLILRGLKRLVGDNIYTCINILRCYQATLLLCSILSGIYIFSHLCVCFNSISFFEHEGKPSKPRQTSVRGVASKEAGEDDGSKETNDE